MSSEKSRSDIPGGNLDMTMDCKAAMALVCFGLLASSAPTLCLGAGKGDKDARVPVRLEIMPGQHEKWVDPILAERIPVAILGTPDLDVREIDAGTLVL